MELDPELLSRIQFGFVVSFHILFPAFTIGLASYIAVLETLWTLTKRDCYLELSQFWTKFFAVSFGMGVVSGIVMTYQFGTNWSRFSELTSPVIGPLLGYEVLTAFFLEATFLGILLFGRRRVPRFLHLLSAYMVAVGTLISAFWILAANSWMHTPSGFDIQQGRFVAIDFWQVVFNPSFPYRFVHMVVACYLTTALVVVGVSAWYVRRDRWPEHARTGMSMGLGLIAVLAPAQLVIGDLHGLNTFEHQPAKVAAMEGHWETQRGAPLLLFAVPFPEEERNRYELAIPRLGSLILTHEAMGEVRGLRSWPAEHRPPVRPVFYAFRVMVGLGLLMIFLGAVSLYLRWRGRLFETDWFLKLCIACLPIGFISILAGWFVTEIGRQPWTVYGFLHRSDSLSPVVSGGHVLTSLAIYFLAYSAIFGAGVYYMTRLARKGPVPGQPEGRRIGGRRPMAGSQVAWDEED